MRKGSGGGATRRQGKGETRGEETSLSLSPCPLVSLSPCLPLPFPFLFAFCRLTPDVPAAQGYRVERHVGNDRSVRSDHLQAEPIASSRLVGVDDRGAERVVPHAVDRRFAEDHPRITDDRERLHGVGLERQKASRAPFGVNQSALWRPVPPVLEVEHESAVPAVVNDGTYAFEDPERGIKDRERRGAGGTGVIIPPDTDPNAVTVHQNVVERRAGRERPAKASSGRGRRLSDRRARADRRKGEGHLRRVGDVARTPVAHFGNGGAKHNRPGGASWRVHSDLRRVRG